jgi:hypothetical protein
MASNMQARMLLELGSSVPMQNHKSITQLRRKLSKIIKYLSDMQTLLCNVSVYSLQVEPDYFLKELE